MARPRQPVDLLVYNGKKNLTKKEIAERKASEVKAPADNIKPPTYLPTKLKKEFKLLSSELVELGIMSNLDTDGLARYLLSKKMFLDVTERLLKMEVVEEVESDDGPKTVINDTYSKLLINQDKLFNQCRQAASDLGLTITSRCKLVIPKAEEEKKESKWSKFGG